MNAIKCPVCKTGYGTTSGHPNLIQHIKNIAKSETLRKHLLGTGPTLHADWLKAKVSVQKIEAYEINLAGETFTIQL